MLKYDKNFMEFKEEEYAKIPQEALEKFVVIENKPMKLSNFLNNS